MEVGLKCRVPGYLDTDPEAGQPTSLAAIHPYNCLSHLHSLFISPHKVEQHLSAAQW